METKPANTPDQSLQASIKEALEGTDVAMVAFESHEKHDRIWGTHQEVMILLRDSKGLGVAIHDKARQSPDIERIVERVRVFGESGAEMRGILHLMSEVQALEIRQNEEMGVVLDQLYKAKKGFVLKPGFFDFCAWEVKPQSRGVTLVATPRGDPKEFNQGVEQLHEIFNFSYHDHSTLTEEMNIYVDDGVVSLRFSSFQALDQMRKQLDLDIRCQGIRDTLADYERQIASLNKSREAVLQTLRELGEEVWCAPYRTPQGR